MKHEIELKPFNIPICVTQVVPVRPREEGFKEAPTYELSELSEVTLSAMCDVFRVKIFAKAGKNDPVHCRD